MLKTCSLFVLVTLVQTQLARADFGMQSRFLPAMNCRFENGAIFQIRLQDVPAGYRTAAFSSRQAKDLNFNARLSEGGRCLSLSCKPGMLKLSNDTGTVQLNKVEGGFSGFLKGARFACRDAR